MEELAPSGDNSTPLNVKDFTDFNTQELAKGAASSSAALEELGASGDNSRPLNVEDIIDFGARQPDKGAASSSAALEELGASGDNSRPLNVEDITDFDTDDYSEYLDRKTRIFPTVQPLLVKWAASYRDINRTGDIVESVSPRRTAVPTPICKPKKINIKIGDASFGCWGSALNIYTGFLKSCPYASVVELPADKVTVKGFAFLYNWMIGDRQYLDRFIVHPPIANRDDILELWMAADLLKVNSVANCCQEQILDKNVYNEMDAFFLVLEARSLNLITIRDLMLNRISLCFLTVIADEEFVNFSSSEVAVLLSSNVLGVHCELEVFFAGLLWFLASSSERQENVVEVMSCVRYKLISKGFLGYMVRNSTEDILREIMVDDIRAKVESALADTEDFPMVSPPIVLTGLPLQRRWIYDERCPYYDEGSSDPVRDLTFQRFLWYLQALNRDNKRWKNFKDQIL